MKQQTEMDKLVEAMQEHICDNLCKWSALCTDQECLERICADCPMGGYVCGILNTYNRLNDFDKSQCRILLEELARERLKHKWIPVTERLPAEHEKTLPSGIWTKISERVAVTVKDIDKNETFVCDDFMHYGNWHDFSGASDHYEVLAWMSLPDPYKQVN